MVKNLPAKAGDEVSSLGGEDPLEGIAFHSSILAWRVPCLTPFRPLSGLQEIPVATREESGVLRFPSRQGLTPWFPTLGSRSDIHPRDIAVNKDKVLRNRAGHTVDTRHILTPAIIMITSLTSDVFLFFLDIIKMRL